MKKHIGFYLFFIAGLLYCQATFAKPAARSVVVVVGDNGYVCPVPASEPTTLFNGDYVIYPDGHVEVVREHQPKGVQVQVTIPIGMIDNTGKPVTRDNVWRWGDPVLIGQTGVLEEQTRSLDHGVVKNFKNTVYYKTDDGMKYVAFSNVLEISEIREPSSLYTWLNQVRDKVSPDVAFRHNAKEIIARRRKSLAAKLGVHESEVPEERLMMWTRPGPARDASEEWPWPPYELPDGYVKTPGQMALPSGRIMTFPPPAAGKTVRVHSFGSTYEADADGNWRDITGSKNPALRRLKPRAQSEGGKEEVQLQTAIDNAYSNLVEAVNIAAEKNHEMEVSDVTKDEVSLELIAALDKAEKALDEFKQLPPDGFTLAKPDPPGFTTVAKRERAKRFAAIRRKRAAEAKAAAE